MPTVTFEVSNEIASDIRGAVARTPSPEQIKELGASDEQVEIFVQSRDRIRKFCQPGQLELDIDEARKVTASLSVSAIHLMLNMRSADDQVRYLRLRDYTLYCGRLLWHAMDDEGRREIVHEAIENRHVDVSLLHRLLVHQYDATPEQLTLLLPDYDGAE